MSDDRAEMAWMDPFYPCFPVHYAGLRVAYGDHSCLVYLVTEMFLMEAIRPLKTPDKGLNQLTGAQPSDHSEARALLILC
jgi:hypothetical protein